MRHQVIGVLAAVALLFPLSSREPAMEGQNSAAVPSHVVIPFLANQTRPADLNFEGAECEINSDGQAMACQFQQVFLTVAESVPDTCLITTNRYERTFRRQADARWISSEGPTGDCGLLDVATLQDNGGVRWTMTIRKDATRREAAACRQIEASSETLGWQNLRRPLPCRFVQPGGLSR
jgi:hypothetical protein